MTDLSQPDSLHDQLQLMSRLTTVVVGRTPLHDTAANLCKEVTEGFGVDACIIRTLERGDLVVLTSCGVPEAELLPRMTAHSGLAGRILETREPLTVDDTQTDPIARKALHAKDSSRPTFDFRSYAGAPLVTEGRIQGLIGIFSKTPRKFGPTDIALLQIAANHLAAVIVNHRLYSELEQKNTVLSETLELHRKAESDLLRARDQLESKVLERTSQLERARDEAQRATVAKTEFLANVSHEIRTPMNAVMGMTELLLTTDLTAAQRDYVETVRLSSEGLLTIINDILDLSKIEAGRLDIQASDFDLRAVAEEVVRILKHTAMKKHVRLMLTVDGGLPERLVGDATRIRQVLLNLTANALKFTHEGEVQVVLRCEMLSGIDRHWRVRCEVRDTGVGIRKATQSLLFRPFSQVDQSSTRAHEGTGLGLVICKRLVEMMHGEIGFESEEGAGSTFYFTLTMRESTVLSALQKRAEDMKQSRRESYDTRAHILIVDDNIVNSKVLSLILQQLGFARVSVVHGGEDALAIVEVGQPVDLILMDCQMPGQDGFETARKLRAGNSPSAQVPIVAITAHALSDADDRSRAAGMNAFLTKPVNIASLEEAFSALIPVMAV